MSTHPALPADAFPEFFRSVSGRDPFRWQVRLAERACAGAWPYYIKLPTASGKTSCIDIAVFALAHQAWRYRVEQRPISAPRRMFFVVDRRIVVNEAYQRATALKATLIAPPESNSSVSAVAWWLRFLAGNDGSRPLDSALPLDCFELRGGIYRDDAWVRSLLQPTVITSTVDQVGSRVLFRGYGVSDRNLAIHAALVANDSLILLDEAHCSNPFSQTLEAVARYRDAGLPSGAQARWSEQPLATPFQFIQMTATPPATVADSDVFRLDDADYNVDTPLAERHGCRKPIRLLESKARGGKQNQLLARDLVDAAQSLAAGADGEPPCRRIAIVVNRVACARLAYQSLLEKHPGRVNLMIGRMRPVDRDQLTKALQERFRSGSSETLSEPHFVVATQCLEVGADFDFDGLVSQCASLDALRQRFGRLNRLGRTQHARGAILMAEGDQAPRKPDPIYGEALPATWTWLTARATDSTIDFGVRVLDRRISDFSREDAAAADQLSTDVVHAPALMPAHVDLLCQTAPRPALEPEIAPLLHGPNRGQPEVRVCWRADLPDLPEPHLSGYLDWSAECQRSLTLCPPASAECLTVPLGQFKAWLRGDSALEDGSSDLLSEQVDEDDEFDPANGKRSAHADRYGLVWNGTKCEIVRGDREGLKRVHPNALIVLPAKVEGWNELGHFPHAPSNTKTIAVDSPGGIDPVEAQSRERARIDIASVAFRQSRGRDILRVHPQLMTCDDDRKALQDLWDYVDQREKSWKHSELRLEEPDDAAPATPDGDRSDSSNLSPTAIELKAVRDRLSRYRERDVKMFRYPGGIMIIGPRSRISQAELPPASFDDDYDEHNLEADSRIALVDHLADVAAETERIATNICLPESITAALVAAAERHDLGKADLRFQALLLNSSLDLAAIQPRLWAKSATGVTEHPAAQATSRTSHQLPCGFRHEMLSLELARRVDDPLDENARELMLHTIAAHHGHARPLAPVVIDDSPPDVALHLSFQNSGACLELTLSSQERLECPAHRLDSGISERFWKLNRRFGWWGLAWLETTLRLADWVASSKPNRGQPARTLRAARTPASTKPPAHFQLPCPGLNGSNPLGFLAALGLFHHIATRIDSAIRMSWDISSGTWSPVYLGNHEALRDQESLVEWLFESLQIDPGQHWLKRLNELPVESLKLTRSSEYRKAASNASHRDRQAADWLSCNGSDLCGSDDNNRLQTARRDYFPESAAAVITAVTSERLTRTLFHPWDYADPIQKVSLHLEPREDRRHAYQWHKPVGDPTRSLRGGMVAANRLAMEAWPLFQSVAVRGELQTVGFRGTRPTKGISWTWPLWQVPLPLCDVLPLLNARKLQADLNESQDGQQQLLSARGICAVFRLRRILVEKTPNFTAPIALFSRVSLDRPARIAR